MLCVGVVSLGYQSLESVLLSDTALYTANVYKSMAIESNLLGSSLLLVTELGFHITTVPPPLVKRLSYYATPSPIFTLCFCDEEGTWKMRECYRNKMNQYGCL